MNARDKADALRRQIMHQVSLAVGEFERDTGVTVKGVTVQYEEATGLDSEHREFAPLTCHIDFEL